METKGNLFVVGTNVNKSKIKKEKILEILKN